MKDTMKVKGSDTERASVKEKRENEQKRESVWG